MSRAPRDRALCAEAMQALERRLVTPEDLEARILDRAAGDLPGQVMQALEQRLITPGDLEARVLHLAEIEASLLDLIAEDLPGARAPEVEGFAQRGASTDESRWAQLAIRRLPPAQPARRLGRQALWIMATAAAISAVAAAFLWLITPAPPPTTRAPAGIVAARDMPSPQEVRRLEEELRASERRIQQLEEQLKASEQRARQLEDTVKALTRPPRAPGSAQPR